MRKLFALLFVAAAFTFVACEKKGETSNADTTAAADSATMAPEAPAADTTAPAAGDSAKVDTAAKAH